MIRQLVAVVLVFGLVEVSPAQQASYVVRFPGVKPGPGSGFATVTDVTDFQNGIKVTLARLDKDVTGQPTILVYSGQSKSGFPITFTVGGRLAPTMVDVGLVNIPNQGAMGVNGRWRATGVFDGQNLTLYGARRCVLSPSFVGGRLTSMAVLDSGGGYIGGETIFIAQPNTPGMQAKATIVVTGDVVTGVTITNPGSGYTLNPLIRVDGPARRLPIDTWITNWPRVITVSTK